MSVGAESDRKQGRISRIFSAIGICLAATFGVAAIGMEVSASLLPGILTPILLAVAGVAAFRYRRSLGIGVLLGAIAVFGDVEESKRLDELRETNPAAFLEEIKLEDEQRWLSELETLDPEGYRVAIAEKREAVSRLEQQVRQIPGADLDANIAGYEKLLTLDPANKKYAEKLATYKQRAADATAKVRAAQKARERMISSPEKYLELSNFSWRKEGFGNLMEASFSIVSKLPFAVKDIEVHCAHTAPSGTQIDSNTRVIYQRLEGKGVMKVDKFDMGFIHSQATRSGCRVTDATPI